MSAEHEIVGLFMQYWTASAVLAAANLGVADALGDSPRSVADLATDLGVDADSLRRLMRGLATVGVFVEGEPGHFAHTARSQALRTGAKGDARALIRMFGLKSTREAMTEYEHAIQSGGSAFERVHGVANPFDVLFKRPDEAAAYHEGMSVESQGAPLVARRLDVGALRTLVDVGGGRGALLFSALAAHPALRGILFDLPEVVKDAAEGVAAAGVQARCEIRGGDLRLEIPRGDGYVLKNILHGWPDADCEALLQRIRAAAEPGARLFVVENVMPEGNDPAPAKTFDLFLLLGGRRSRVRGREEFRRLLTASGWTMGRVVRVFGEQCVVEATLS